MSAKEKQKLGKIISIMIIILVLLIAIYIKFISNKETYAMEENTESNTLKISNAQAINIDTILDNNNHQSNYKEEIYEKQEELEYITKYKYNSDLYQGTTAVSQEGKNGIQTITMKKIFDKQGNFLYEEQVSAIVTKSSINKIIDIGTKVYVEPTSPEVETKKEENQSQTTKKEMSFDIALNKPSGLSLSEFKTALTDEKDVNKIFQNNAEYFYYIEEEYKINGIFVAAIGIHESAWGTSKLAKLKYNLFGYGAYDYNPYNGAYSFSSYSESIDLIARVLVKYYINPAGTPIYDGNTATGKYYNGNTLSAVNKKYATDQNWANSVYKYMQYLYSKIYASSNQ